MTQPAAAGTLPPMSATRLGIVLFTLAAALGPWYTAEGYSPLRHVISELAAQNTPRNVVMSAAFVALGGSVVLDGVRRYRREWLPFIVFGLCIALAGLFGHRPITPAVPYSPAVDAAHSALATLSGVALTIGFAWQAWRAGSGEQRALAAALALWCVVLPLLMLAWPLYQGAIQRVMYLTVFGWLWVCYPGRDRDC